MTVLLLVPTQFEADLLRPSLPVDSTDFQLEICGFGPVAAGVVTAALIADLRPRKIVLAGLAGSLCTDAVIGTACHFDRVAMYGVGAGNGEDFVTAGEMGWAHVCPPVSIHRIGDVIPLHRDDSSHSHQKLLVTSCAASANSVEAAYRRQKFPDGIAEDMEGFAVAVACQMSHVPLQIVRGISNIAGQRDQSEWQTERALQSVANLLMELLR